MRLQGSDLLDATAKWSANVLRWEAAAMAAAGPATEAPDLSTLTDEELEQYEAISRKASKAG
jgi:hypothetical protein